MKTKSSTAIWMPLFLGEHFIETFHLTTRQQGAYLLLTMMAWRSGGVLPADEARLAEFARLTPEEWAQDRSKLADLFEVGENEWRHARLAEEYQRTGEVRQVRKQAGSNSAAKRQQTANHSHSHSQSESSEAKASGAAPDSPSKDLTGVVFDLGLKWLIDRSGRPEPHCRSLRGKWRKKIGADAGLIELLSKAQREGVIDPVPWMERAIAERAPPHRQGFN